MNFNTQHPKDKMEFVNSMRGQYIISQALTMARRQLIKYEKDKNLSKAEPSNRKDMDYLLEVFPLYKIHEKSFKEIKT